MTTRWWGRAIERSSQMSNTLINVCVFGLAQRSITRFHWILNSLRLKTWSWVTLWIPMERISMMQALSCFWVSSMQCKSRVYPKNQQPCNFILGLFNFDLSGQLVCQKLLKYTEMARSSTVLTKVRLSSVALAVRSPFDRGIWNFACSIPSNQHTTISLSLLYDKSHNCQRMLLSVYWSRRWLL